MKQNMEYLSLAQVLQGTRSYKHLPQPLQEGLKWSVLLTLFTEVAMLLLFVFIPYDVWWTRVKPNGFFLGPTVDITNAVLDIAVGLLPYLIVINLFNLFLTLVILTVSLLLFRPVQGSVHWLAVMNTIPTGLNALVVSILLCFFITIIVVNLIIWAIIITFVMFTVYYSLKYLLTGE